MKLICFIFCESRTLSQKMKHMSLHLLSFQNIMNGHRSGSKNYTHARVTPTQVGTVHLLDYATIFHWKLLPRNRTCSLMSFAISFNIEKSLLVQKSYWWTKCVWEGVFVLVDNTKPLIAKITWPNLNELCLESLPRSTSNHDLAPFVFHFFRF